MRRNPYLKAAEVEAAIVDLHKKLKTKEKQLVNVINHLKLIKPDSKKAKGLRDSLSQREKDIHRTRANLKKKIQLKRKLEKEGKNLQFGGYKKQKKLIEVNRDYNREIKKQDSLLSQLKNIHLTLKDSNKATECKRNDVFISHASEDKESFVKLLADELIKQGVSVWYDEYSLRIGDSLRKSIDKGLSDSRFGLIVLSKSFFEKNWTQYELNGLVAKEMQGEKVILPIWHNITKDEVLEYSPTLVDKVALNTTMFSVKEIAEKITDAIEHA